MEALTSCRPRSPAPIMPSRMRSFAPKTLDTASEPARPEATLPMKLRRDSMGYSWKCGYLYSSNVGRGFTKLDEQSQFPGQVKSQKSKSFGNFAVPTVVLLGIVTSRFAGVSRKIARGACNRGKM